MNKTIYIRDEDIGVWDKARELAGEKLSPVIIAALKRFVSENEGVAKGFERIVVQYADSKNHDIPTAKAFIGRWIISPEEAITDYNGRFSDGPTMVAVAITAKARAVIYSWADNQENQKSRCFNVYDSLEFAATDSQCNFAVRAAMEILGVPIEDLDI